MKTNLLFLIVFIGALVVSCGVDHDKLVELNDTLITVNDGLGERYEVWSNKLDEIMELDPEDRNYQQLKPFREAFDDDVKSQLKKVENLENKGGSENFKASVIEFLNHQKKFSEIHLQKFEHYNSETTEDELMEVGMSMLDAFEEEEKLISKVNKEQEIYAAKNKIKLITRKGN